MFRLDYGDHRPLYEQIKEKYKQLIVNGVLNQDDKIPSVRELAGMLAINPNTIQKAYKDLEAEGFIYSIKAKGSFVAPKKELVKRSNTDEILNEFKQLVKKLKFLDFCENELCELVKNEFLNDDN